MTNQTIGICLYRPLRYISVLPIISRFFENLIFDQFYDFDEINSSFPNSLLSETSFSPKVFFKVQITGI